MWKFDQKVPGKLTRADTPVAVTKNMTQWFRADFASTQVAATASPYNSKIHTWLKE